MAALNHLGLCESGRSEGDLECRGEDRPQRLPLHRCLPRPRRPRCLGFASACRVPSAWRLGRVAGWEGTVASAPAGAALAAARAIASGAEGEAVVAPAPNDGPLRGNGTPTVPAESGAYA